MPCVVKLSMAFIKALCGKCIEAMHYHNQWFALMSSCTKQWPLQWFIDMGSWWSIHDSHEISSHRATNPATSRISETLSRWLAQIRDVLLPHLSTQIYVVAWCGRKLPTGRRRPRPPSYNHKVCKYNGNKRLLGELYLVKQRQVFVCIGVADIPDLCVLNYLICHLIHSVWVIDCAYPGVVAIRDIIQKFILNSNLFRPQYQFKLSTVYYVLNKINLVLNNFQKTSYVARVCM